MQWGWCWLWLLAWNVCVFSGLVESQSTIPISRSFSFTPMISLSLSLLLVCHSLSLCVCVTGRAGTLLPPRPGVFRELAATVSRLCPHHVPSGAVVVEAVSVEVAARLCNPPILCLLCDVVIRVEPVWPKSWSVCGRVIVIHVHLCRNVWLAASSAISGVSMPKPSDAAVFATMKEALQFHPDRRLSTWCAPARSAVEDAAYVAMASAGLGASGILVPVVFSSGLFHW